MLQPWSPLQKQPPLRSRPRRKDPWRDPRKQGQVQGSRGLGFWGFRVKGFRGLGTRGSGVLRARVWGLGPALNSVLCSSVSGLRVSGLGHAARAARDAPLTCTSEPSVQYRSSSGSGSSGSSQGLTSVAVYVLTAQDVLNLNPTQNPDPTK